MTDHNPYVGIQRTVFEQGWKRACSFLLKNLEDMQKATSTHDYDEVLTHAFMAKLITDVRDGND